ncbi:MAG: glycosyltransferase [Alicyclobacillus sp.]|nr:glycosyltransferase [Alicyclobacillus sp.]
MHQSSTTAERVRQSLAAGEYQQAQVESAEELRRNPVQVGMWYLLGEALEGMGLCWAAWKAYERAWLFDPQAQWVAEKRQRCARYTGEELPPWLAELLAVPRVTLTGAMIAKNEERTIGQAIERLKPAVDEVIVVDTGSTDRTPDIARELGAKVCFFEWNDDFSAARNFGLSQVTSDWVLWVDADELLHPDDIDSPRTIAGAVQGWNRPVLFRIAILNQLGSVTLPNYDVIRLFPTRYGLHFWRRIHEQVRLPEDSPHQASLLQGVARIRVYHDGYQPGVVADKDKWARNVRLLRQAVADEPGDIGSWAFLGRELCYAGQFEEAVDVLFKVEQMAKAVPSFARLPEVRGHLVAALQALHRHDEALLVARRAAKDNPEYPGAWYVLGNAQIASALKLLKEAEDSFLRAKATAPHYRGVMTVDARIPLWKADVGMADTRFLQGDWVGAKALYEQVANLTASLHSEDMTVRERLRHIKEQADRLSSPAPGVE